MAVGLSIKDAASLVNRSTDTIYRWRAGGCDVSDRRSLLEYSEIQDMRSRGNAAKLASDRAGAHSSKQILACSVRCYFPPLPDPEKFYDIPSPLDSNLQTQATNLLHNIQAFFTNRLIELRSIGHEKSVEMGEEDLRNIMEGRRLIEMVLHSFHD